MSASNATARIRDTTDKSKRPDGVSIWPLGFGAFFHAALGSAGCSTASPVAGEVE